MPQAPKKSTWATPTKLAEKSLVSSLPETGYVRLSVVLSVSGLAKSTIWKWCADGRFPKPRKLGTRVSAWPVAEVRAWLADPNAWMAVQRANAEGA